MSGYGAPEVGFLPLHLSQFGLFMKPMEVQKNYTLTYTLTHLLMEGLKMQQQQQTHFIIHILWISIIS